MSALGQGLPVGGPALTASVAGDLPLVPILAASFPESCTVDDLLARFRQDALSGEDRLGFNARMVDDEVRVSYRLTTAIWTKA
jgi:hypothetical protein